MFSCKNVLTGMTLFWSVSLVMAGICYMLPSGAQDREGHATNTMLEVITALMSFAAFFMGLIMPIAIKLPE